MMSSNARRDGFAFAICLIAMVLAAGPALASKKVPAAGFWRTHRDLGPDYGLLLPLQFVLNTGMGTVPLGFPNDDVMGAGDVTVCKGVLPADPWTLMVPAAFFSGAYAAAIGLNGSDFVQLSTQFATIKAPGPIGAMFSKNGGLGDYTFCPGTPAGTPGPVCPAGGIPQGTDLRHGRLKYSKGLNQFGGVARTFLNGVVRRVLPRAGFGFIDATFHASHLVGTYNHSLAVGGTAGVTSMHMNGFTAVTNPLTAPATNESIGAKAGPFVTVGGDLTACPAGPNIPGGCVVGGGALLMPGNQTTTDTGFPFTTGTVVASQTTNPNLPFMVTVSGTDLRVNGIGNIVMVAGSMRTRTGVAIGSSMEASFDTVTLSLTSMEKVPSLSPSGFMAGALLMVIAAGYVHRRRI